MGDTPPTDFDYRLLKISFENDDENNRNSITFERNFNTFTNYERFLLGRLNYYLENTALGRLFSLTFRKSWTPLVAPHSAFSYHVGNYCARGHLF